jgi:hypothetical protein
MSMHWVRRRLCNCPPHLVVWPCAKTAAGPDPHAHQSIVRRVSGRYNSVGSWPVAVVAR